MLRAYSSGTKPLIGTYPAPTVNKFLQLLRLARKNIANPIPTTTPTA